MKYTSPASRNLKKLYNPWYLKKKFHSLTFKKPTFSGKSPLNRRICRTKSSVLIRSKIFTVNYSMRYFLLGFIVTFQLIPYQNLLLTLIFFANGAVTYFVKGFKHKIFKYIFFPQNLWEKKFTKHFYCSWIAFFNKLTIVSLIELIPGNGIKYCRSAGASAQIKKINVLNKSVLLKINKKDLFKTASLYSITTLGPVSFKNKKKIIILKSGYWRSFGEKPIVRGVAKNPVDHPHGGRTKSIKNPRTPWGKPTKK